MVPEDTLEIYCGDGQQIMQWVGYTACARLSYLRGAPSSAFFLHSSGLSTPAVRKLDSRSNPALPLCACNASSRFPPLTSTQLAMPCAMQTRCLRAQRQVTAAANLAPRLQAALWARTCRRA